MVPADSELSRIAVSRIMIGFASVHSKHAGSIAVLAASWLCFMQGSFFAFLVAWLLFSTFGDINLHPVCKDNFVLTMGWL